MLSVEVRHATLTTHHRKRRRRRTRRTEGGGGGGGGGEEAEDKADIKSNNPHLTGGEKHDHVDF